MDEMTTCCFTGHRPEKLPWHNLEDDPRCIAIKERIFNAIIVAYESGYRHFISGMAKGTDLYFAEAVLALRNQYPDMTLETARPCETHGQQWNLEQRKRYQTILNACDIETMVQHVYDRGCMLRRNRYMVDKSSLVIAVYDGTPKGGTYYTLANAIHKGKTVEILDLE